MYAKSAGPLPPPPEVINHDNAENQSSSSELVTSFSF